MHTSLGAKAKGGGFGKQQQLLDERLGRVEEAYGAQLPRVATPHRRYPTDLPRDAEAFVGKGSCGESVSAWRTVQPAVLARVGAAAKRGSRAQRILGGNRRKVTECLARDYRCFPAPMRGAH